MSTFWRQQVLDQVARGATLDRIEQDLELIRSIGDDERAALWLLAWAEQERDQPISPRLDASQEIRPIGAGPRSGPGSSPDPITAALKLAQAETEMDDAVLGEVCDGREVVRFVAGTGSFGLAPGASMPIEDTFCHLLLTGRLSNVVSDAQADERVRDLPITRLARVGAYLGVPLTGLDARLYVLCCLAREQRPQLGERDVRFLRRLGEATIGELDNRRSDSAHAAR